MVGVATGMAYTLASLSRDIRVTTKPRLRNPVSAARVVCGNHPVAVIIASMVAPSAL